MDIMWLKKMGVPVIWNRDVWEDPVESENFEPSDSPGFISPEEVVAPILNRKCTPTPTPWNTAFSALDWGNESFIVCWISSDFSLQEMLGNNTDVLQGPPVVPVDL